MQTQQVQVFTLEELTTLYEAATPKVRLLMLLGLNCGFAAAESGTLFIEDIHLHQQHPNAKKVGIDSTDADSWILRTRPKTGVYGEWRLWPETVASIEAQIAKRGTKTGLLIVSKMGVSLVKPTVTGNKSSRIPSLWNNTYRKAQKENPSLRKLAFKHLRKTAGDLIRDVSDGETAGVFLSHGTPVRSDSLAEVYTNRPFRRVFEALDKVRGKLAPMFASV